ncbi:peptide chain release factor N(5)-glutamine methyltransferase [Polycyclovorans algicola]|uniref:peptide chain release factor N(5)-glutamine methyltransferase n=1 Tax=Polycyclovorans algicola TaxID=616992 RepID=UPI0004A749AC|nr:peptide chain release factor N(5)-glutamine methyltransferase [Polycyclovorans algicola]
MRLAEAIADAMTRLQAVSDSPRQDAEWLLGDRLGYSRAQLFTRLDHELAPVDAEFFERLIARRAKGEPVAYLLGEKGFWTFSVAVSPAVLVPRPETELLVAWALAWLNDLDAPTVVDLGTGSGVIALALKLERPDAQVTAIDLSPEALVVARGNAQRLGVAIDWQTADFGEWLLGQGAAQDLIVSNPPYVAARDPHLASLRFEPQMALTDGFDGLNALRVIIANARHRLRPGGGLMVEHGFDQRPAVQALFVEAGFDGVETRLDLGGQPRATVGRAP